ncbi:hypothetical protein CEXT_217451 [Caerostris extrusa]|uniref:Uncharacterized protein n=1 Tax=Caerostris extrusa TaxID=172846 RepID=A0AAV4XBP2_CAEEX|nr:hypothetical protein CEXT_217451 [Caerostris extrusa]
MRSRIRRTPRRDWMTSGSSMRARCGRSGEYPGDPKDQGEELPVLRIVFSSTECEGFCSRAAEESFRQLLAAGTAAPPQREKGKLFANYF